MDRITGQLSDTRTRFLGTRPPKLFAAAVKGQRSMLSLSSRPWLAYSDMGRYNLTPLSYESLDHASGGWASPASPPPCCTSQFYFSSQPEASLAWADPVNLHMDVCHMECGTRLGYLAKARLLPAPRPPLPLTHRPSGRCCSSQRQRQLCNARSVIAAVICQQSAAHCAWADEHWSHAVCAFTAVINLQVLHLSSVLRALWQWPRAPYAS